MSDGSLIFDTGIDSSGFKSALTGLSGMAVKAGAAVGAALGAAFVGSVAVGGNYEASLAKVGTIADTTKVSLTALSDGIKSLSKETGASASELNETLYQAISAGADTAHAVDLVETAAKAAKAGFTDTTTAVDGLTSALNAFGMETTDAEGLANKFLITQNLGKTSFGELASSIGTVAPTANAAGVSIDELLASVTSLTANGIATSEAMTGLKAIMSNIIKPTSEASDLAKELGINFSASALKSMGFTAFLEDIKEKTGGDTEKMSQLFGSVEALNSVLTLTSEQGTELMNSALEEMATNTTALDTAYEQMTDTFDTALQKMLNSAKLLGVAAFDNIKEPLKEGAEAIAEEFDALSESMDSSGLSEVLKNASEGFSKLLPQALKLATDVLPGVITLLSSVTKGVLIISDSLVKSNIGGSITKIADSIAEIIEPVAEFTADIIPTAAKGLELIANNTDLVEAALLGAAAGFVAFKAAAVVTTVVAGIQEANLALALLTAQSGAAAVSQTALSGGLTLTEIAVGLFTGKITLATAAQAAFNAVAAINPYVLLATAVATAGVAIAVYALKADTASKSIKEANKALEEASDKIEDNNKQTNVNISMLESKVSVYEELRKQYELTGQGEEELKSIMQEIQQLSPTTIKFIDDETGAYLSLAGAVDNAVEALKRKREIENSETELEALYNSVESLESDKKKIQDDINQNAVGWAQIAAESNNLFVKALFSNRFDQQVNEIEKIDKDIAEKNEEIKKAEQKYNNAFKSTSKKTTLNPVNSAWDASLLGFGKVTEQINGEKEQVIGEIDNAAAEISEEFKAKYEQLQTDRIYGTKSEAEYYTALENLLDEYQAYGNSAYNSYYSDLFNYQKSAEENLTEQAKQEQQERLQNLKDTQKQELSSVKSTLSDIVSTYKQQYNAVLSEQKSYTDGIRSQLDLFKKEETDDKITYSLENLADYKKAVSAYTSSIKKLKERGVNDALLSEIQDAGMEDGTAYAKILLSKSDEELKELNDTYSEIDSMIEQSGKDMYGSQLDSINQNFVSEVSGLFGSLPAEIQGIGLESALAFAQGLSLSSGDAIAQTEQFCDDLMTVISDGIDNGTVSAKGLTDNLIADFKAQTPDVLAAVNNMLNFDGLAAKVKAAVTAEVSATSTAVAAGAGAKSYAKPEENQVQNSMKSFAAELNRMLSDINKPLNIYLDRDKLGNANISFANLKSRQTGRLVFT